MKNTGYIQICGTFQLILVRSRVQRREVPELCGVLLLTYLHSMFLFGIGENEVTSVYVSIKMLQNSLDIFILF